MMGKTPDDTETIRPMRDGVSADLDVAAAAEPGLTSVRVAIERRGALARELLLERIGGSPAPTAAKKAA